MAATGEEHAFLATLCSGSYDCESDDACVAAFGFDSPECESRHRLDIAGLYGYTLFALAGGN